MSSKKYKYGICNLSVVPVRKDSSSISELITQLMFGELYTITKQVEKWYYIKVEDDSYNGWVNYTQIRIISKIDFDILNLVKPKYSIKIIDFIYKNSEPTLISMGSKISSCQYLGYTYKGDFSEDINNKTILESATKFLNSPYLWGGKTSLGVDCSGFTQIVYKIKGLSLFFIVGQIKLLYQNKTNFNIFILYFCVSRLVPCIPHLLFGYILHFFQALLQRPGRQ